MFYSETLLSKTGPLARVWLSANLERKLSKTHILQQNVKDSVDAIVDPNQAPMALRLSGQLLLGVVRIYSRKARYLLDDCNEALMKIKMAFRLSGNNDMPVGLHLPSRDALMLPDVLTEGDNLEMPPMPDASFLLEEDTRKRGSSRDINLQEDFGSSHFQKFDEELALDPDDLDLGLDLGLDIDVEVGRHAPKARPVEDDLSIDMKRSSLDRDIVVADDFHLDDDGDIDMGDLTFNVGDQGDMLSKPMERARISESPLSDLDPTLEREFEEVEVRRPAQRRRLKPVKIDDKDGTMLSSAVIKAQQKDRSKILKAQTFLPRDATLMALMEMQRNGGFVSNIMHDGRSLAWAPELRGMLSLDAIRSNDLKRKRSPEPQLDFDTVELDFAPAFDFDDEPAPLESREPTPIPFDDTTMPLVHPADSGPVSQGTKHAVHLLREQFGDAEDSPAKRRQTTVVFQDLLPEQTTTSADATKMFFEVLVLATKDAIKVEQSSDTVGAPIRVRGKRGLWGAWAEKEAGGEIEV